MSSHRILILYYMCFILGNGICEILFYGNPIYGATLVTPLKRTTQGGVRLKHIFIFIVRRFSRKIDA